MVEVRPARKGDLPAIRSLVGRYPKKLMQQDLPRLASFFVATLDGEIVGCCALQIYSRRLAEIRSLAVHPDFGRQGIARMLVARCQQRAKQRRVQQILAVTSETEFFGRLGFTTFFGEKTALFYDLPGAAAGRART